MAGPISPHYILSTLPIGIIIRYPGKLCSISGHGVEEIWSVCERVTSTSPPMTTMDKVTQHISIKILAHLVNKNLLQMCFRCKYAFFVLFLNQNSCIDIYAHSCLKPFLIGRKPCSNRKTHVQIMKFTCRLNMAFRRRHWSK